MLCLLQVLSFRGIARRGKWFQPTIGKTLSLGAKHMIIEASVDLREVHNDHKKAEVIAIKDKGQVHSLECVNDADMDGAETSDCILENEDDDHFVFCSDCNQTPNVTEA